jgi:peptide/nickel transport system substrate-binding protein
MQHRFTSTVYFFISILFLGTGLISCKENSQKSAQVFSYNQSEGVSTLDPGFAKNQAIIWVVHQLYNTLIETDSNLNLVPSLAKSWEVSDDRLTYTFHLRNDVTFHDNQAFPQGQGRKMVAEDVVYSFKRIVDKNTASSGSWIFNNRVDSTNGFSAPDDTTFQLRLIRPFHPILEILSMQYCSIVPKEVVEKYGKEFRNLRYRPFPISSVGGGAGFGFI